MSTPAVSARLLVALAGLAAGTHPGAQEAAADAYRQHLERDGLRVDVWSTQGAPLEYEIELRRLDEPAARLSGNGRGPLLASTLTDLDGDGYIEALLLFDAPAPRDALRLYEWNDRFLERVETAPPPGPAAPGAVRGQYRVAGDALLWESARHARASDPQPLERNAWRYDFAAGAWTAIEIEDGRDSLIGRLPFFGREDEETPAAPAAAPGDAADPPDAAPKRSLLSRLPFVGGDDDAPAAPDSESTPVEPLPEAPATQAGEPPAAAKRSLLRRLPFMGDDDDAPSAPDSESTPVEPLPEAPATQAGEPPTAAKRSLLRRLPFVGDDEDAAPDGSAAAPSAPAAPPDAEPAAPEAKKRSLLDRLPFVGDDDEEEDESVQAGAEVFDAPAPVP